MTRALPARAEIDPGTPKRVQRKRTKGWRMPANTVYVGRPGQDRNTDLYALRLDRHI